MKALDTSIVKLEKDWGGKPDVAIEVLRQMRSERQELKDQMHSRKSMQVLLRTAIAAREKVVIKLDGLQKEEVDLTQLSLLKQQEIADAKNDAAENAREVETLEAKRPAEVDCDGSVSHVSAASCSSPLSPQQWALGLASSLPEDARIKFEEWHTSTDFEPKASVHPHSEVLSQVSPATPQQADPVSTTPIATTSAGSNFPAGKAPFPLAAGCAVCCGVSDKARVRSGRREQSRFRMQAPGHCRRESFKNERALGVGACHGRPSGAGVRGCTMADFSRRVPLDELRGRGLMKGLQPEILEQISTWPLAKVAVCKVCTQLIAYTDGSAVHAKSLAKVGG